MPLSALSLTLGKVVSLTKDQCCLLKSPIASNSKENRDSQIKGRNAAPCKLETYRHRCSHQILVLLEKFTFQKLSTIGRYFIKFLLNFTSKKLINLKAAL